jgi:cytoskeletal protein CcmA (bactofilin family)
LLAGFPAPAGATEIHTVESYTLEKGQVIHDDLIVKSPRIEIDGTVDGDLIVLGRDVTVHGHVTGDIISLVQDLRVDGTVDDNIRGFAGNLTLDGSVGKNVSIATQNLDFGSGAKIGGSLTTIAGDSPAGRQVGAQPYRVSVKHVRKSKGPSAAKLCLYGDHLSIGSTAVLSGPVDFTGAEPPEVSDGAHLVSPVHFEQRRKEQRQVLGIDVRARRPALRRGSIWSACC